MPLGLLRNWDLREIVISGGHEPGSNRDSSGSRSHELGSEGDHLSSGVNEQGSG